jgi:hypothetical protein
MNIRPQAPPFDGKPCPVCPIEVRNLTAVVHNLAWRLLAYHGGCASTIIEKFHLMQSAVSDCRLPEDAPTELRQLWLAAEAASKATRVVDLLPHGTALKAATDAVQPLVDSHFADRQHSHGQLR